MVVCCTLRQTNRNEDSEILPSHARKDLSDAISLNGFISALPEFEKVPSFRMWNRLSDDQKNGKLIKIPNWEVVQIRREQNIATEIESKVPPSHAYVIKKRD